MLSIVIITCNRAEEVINAIKSCIDHVSIDFEIVLVDNASTDCTERRVRELSADKGFALNYIKMETNTGVSFARNVGYRAAKGDIVYFIDDDAHIVSNGNTLDSAYQYMLEKKLAFAMGSRSFDARINGYHRFVKSRLNEEIIRNYVGFNHFVRKNYSSENYLYPDNLFYGAEELYVGLSVLYNGGYTFYYEGHEVVHNPSKNVRWSEKTNKENGHINTRVIKSYYLKGIFNAISEMLFILRIARFHNYNAKELVRCMKIKKQRYDRRYSKKLGFLKTMELIKMFGVRAIL